MFCDSTHSNIFPYKAINLIDKHLATPAGKTDGLGYANIFLPIVDLTVSQGIYGVSELCGRGTQLTHYSLYRGTQRICSSKYMFLWNLLLAS